MLIGRRTELEVSGDVGRFFLRYNSNLRRASQDGFELHKKIKSRYDVIMTIWRVGPHLFVLVRIAIKTRARLISLLLSAKNIGT